MKCTVQEAKSPVKISSGSVARRDLIPTLKEFLATLSILNNASVETVGIYFLYWNWSL
jgi:hypothetical protein